MSPQSQSSQGWDENIGLPEEAAYEITRPFGIYVHVPFCVKRCGYCDFNTYTNLHFGAGASASEYAATLTKDIEYTAKYLQKFYHLHGQQIPPVTSVFFGGGTPTMLPATHLTAVIQVLKENFGIASQAEVTTEANPETVNEQYLNTLSDGGFTRVSFGMQSAVPKVIKILDREHTVQKVPQVVADAKIAGLQTSVDLIYGTPGETTQDWLQSLKAVKDMQPDHVSAYALGIETGTKIGALVQRGQISPLGDDILANRYEIADDFIHSHGYQWYEVSNWALPGKECRHNLSYWRNDNWWGFGPGAHSHIGRWRGWNLRHPRKWAEKVAENSLPVQGAEVVDDDGCKLEEIMLSLRLKWGVSFHKACQEEWIDLRGSEQRVLALVQDGWLDEKAWQEQYMRPTRKGRLMLDSLLWRLRGDK